MLALVIALPTMASAQDIQLGAGGADLILTGVAPNANAGAWLDQGPVSNGDSRRDPREPRRSRECQRADYTGRCTSAHPGASQK